MATPQFDLQPSPPLPTTTSPTSPSSPSPPDSFHTLFGIVLGAAVLLGLALALLIILFTRRRNRRAARELRRSKGLLLHDEDADDDDGEVVMTSSGSSGSSESSEEGRGSGSRRGRGRGVGSGDGDGCEGEKGEKGRGGGGRGRRLQKAYSYSLGGGGGGWPTRLEFFDDGDGDGWMMGRRTHRSMPLIPRVCTKGHFHFGFSRSESCRWPSGDFSHMAAAGVMEMGEVKGKGAHRRNPSWIDEDALHGPKVSVELDGARPQKKEKKTKKERGSWPLRNRAPTLPRVHHTVHGYPYASGGRRGESSEALLGDMQTAPATVGADYAQLRGFSRGLPEPPKPALVANRDRRVLRTSVTMGGYVYGLSRIPKPVLSPPASPVKSLPTTPSRHRGRQQSTDSTLSEILRSTEQRLRAGSVSGTIRNNGVPASPTRASPPKGAGPREYSAPVARSRTPSPKKHAPVQTNSLPGHKRHESHQSESSEADSSVGAEGPDPDVPTGLTSPSRTPKKAESAKQSSQVQSVRTSLSSELSTLYSEDEMPDEVRKAIRPLEGFVVQPQLAKGVRPPSSNDPFVAAPSPLAMPRVPSMGQTWAVKQSKSQDLFRATLQRSQRLRSKTVGQSQGSSPELILAPGPVMRGALQTSLPVLPPSRKASVTIPLSMQPYIAASSASEPPPSPTRESSTSQSPSGPLFLRVTKTSTLSTIPLLPPPSTPSFNVMSVQQQPSRPPSPTKAQLLQEEQQQSSGRRSSVRLSPLLTAPKKHLQELQHNRASTSSSVYSQDTASPGATTTTKPAASGAVELNRANFRANFRANASLYPAPLSPSKLSSSEMPGDNSEQTDAEGETDVEGTDDEESGGAPTAAPTAITSTIASLRRMNSGISTVSSLRSITDRNPTPSPERSPSPSYSYNCSPERGSGTGIQPALAPGTAAAESAAAGVTDRHAHRKSIGARNYFTMGAAGAAGNSNRQSRRGSRVVSGAGFAVGGIVKSPSAGAVVGGAAGTSNAAGGAARQPSKRRRPGSMRHHQRRASAVLRLSSSDFGVIMGTCEEGKENHNHVGGSVVGNGVVGGGVGGGGFKMAAGEFTFEVSSPSSTNLPVAGSGKGGGLGLREGSAGNVIHQQQQPGQRLSLAWKPAVGGGEGHGSVSPSRASVRSVDSLGLYDRQGFLISASPVRGVSPMGLRV